MPSSPYLLIVLLLWSCTGSPPSRESVDKNTAPASTDALLPGTMEEIEAFVPEGYEVLDFERADLNNDAQKDVLLILKSLKEEEAMEEEVLRPMLLLIRSFDRGLKLAAQNNKVVYCYRCGGTLGDPYIRTAVKGKYFSVEHYGGGGLFKFSKIVTFKFDEEKDHWLLHQDGSEYFELNPNSGDNAEAIVKTGERILTRNDFGTVRFEEYDIYQASN